MKKLFLIVGLFAITGCKKAQPKTSNCGTVVAKSTKLDTQGNVIGYQLGIINEFTNNQAPFDVSYSTYLSVKGLDRYCVDGVTTW